MVWKEEASRAAQVGLEEEGKSQSHMVMEPQKNTYPNLKGAN